MKILFVEPHESSLFSFRKEVVDDLINRGFDVVLCTDVTEKTQQEYSQRVSKIVNVSMNLKDKGILSNARLKRTYKRIIHSEKPDLIISYKIKPNIYCGLAAKKTPMIANITGLGNMFKKSGFLSKLGIFLYKRAFKNIDFILFQNEDSLAFFRRHKIPIKNFKVIPGSGVNIDKFQPQLVKPFSDKTINFLFASRAIKEKGFDLLIDAIPAVLINNNDIHFTILSAEEDVFANDKAKDVFSKYQQNITILSRTDDMAKLYCSHDYLVSPSFYREGISNVLLESLACARPIITTNDNPGCMEVLQEGVNGFGVTSNDLDSLVAALLLASKQSKSTIEKMGNNGREFVSKHFNRQTVVNTYSEVIDKMSLGK